MGCSLDKLVSNLKEKDKKEKKTLQETFPNTYAYFKKSWNHVDDDGFWILSRKGVYPYEYMNSFDKFEEKQLPDIEKFYSSLTDENISDDDYKFAQDILTKFKLKNLGGYHDIYLETDVMLLADVFETFRRSIMKKYKLDPAHFLTAPGLSWVACLKMTKVKLELLTDPDMSMFIDMAMLGGFSAVLFPFAKANHAKCGIYKPYLEFL